MNAVKNLRPPAPYFGGKFGTIGHTIADLINLTPHKCYVEPFGGMAGVLFLKNPSTIEVYNDLDGRLVNLFRVLRNKKKATELKRQLKLTPFSREEYLACQKVIKAPLADDIEWARSTIVCLSMSIQPSLRHNGFKNGGVKYETSVARQFQKRVNDFPQITERFAEVIIEMTFAERLMTRFDSPETLIYLDPPYVKSTRNKGTNYQGRNDYSCEMEDDYHQVLLVVCLQLKSKIIISGYDHPIYNDLLNSWHRLEIEVTSAIAGSQTNPGDINMKRTEIIWSNFRLHPQLKLEL